MTDGKKIKVTGLPDTGAGVSVMPIKTWQRMGFTREDLIPTNLRLAAAYQGAHETFSSNLGSFNHVSSTNKRLGGKTKWDTGVDVEGVLFPIHY